MWLSCLLPLLLFADLLEAQRPGLRLGDETRRNVRKRVTNMIRERLGRRSKEVCYDLLGCFPVDGPLLKKGPQDPKEVDTRFYLFTREKESEGISYTDGRESLVSSHFDATKPTKFIIHGFKGSSKDISARIVVEQLLNLEDGNVILLDWAKGASGPSYRLSAANTQLVGKQLELILLDMISLGTSPSQIHIIGFSLGAHIAGYAGRSLSHRGIKLGRITGLDPASPLFRESFTSLPALSKEDAAFVDVIHTDGSILLTEGFGLLRALGHVDFFPNGGQDQPGCEYIFASVLVSHLEGTVNSSTICNHARGFQLFMESVTSKQDGCQFRSFPCISREHFRSGACFPNKCETNSTDGSCGIMGYNADLGLARGPLYMVTREERPFCGDQLQSIVVLAKNSIKPRSSILLSAKVEDDNTSFELRNEPRDPFQGYVYRGLSASMYGLYNSHLSNVTVTLVLRYAPRKIGEIIIAEYVRIANLDGDYWSYCGKPVIFEPNDEFGVTTVNLTYKAC
ncbi:pancreatic triacylglycerol lipase [Halyomorpha halys]|uniref:pancreatic triacylglycerol lipase n=1 Tax=Halyomorpha halys TaxID=286706 RepID=UPI0006D4F381